MSKSEQGLKVELKDGVVNISIGVDALAYAVQAGDEWPEQIKILDNHLFAKSIVDLLCEEDGDTGETAVHFLLDKAALEIACEGNTNYPDCISE